MYAKLVVQIVHPTLPDIFYISMHPSNMSAAMVVRAVYIFRINKHSIRVRSSPLHFYLEYL